MGLVIHFKDSAEESGHGKKSLDSSACSRVEKDCEGLICPLLLAHLY